MTSKECPDVLQGFLLKNSNLFKDVLQLRSSDIVSLTRRLEAATKHLTQISSTLDPAKDNVDYFITQLVRCFIGAGETTRISRCLEKMIRATGPCYQDVVQKTVGTELLCTLHQLSEHGKELKKVSALLEHSKLVQTEMCQHMPILLEQLGCLFKDLLGFLPHALSREDNEKLYYTVKLSLQIFQQFPKMREEGWIFLKPLISRDGVTVNSNPLAQIVDGILAVLVRKNYAREVTLLAGTALTMLMNAASTVEDCAISFFAVQCILTDGIPGTFVQDLSNLHIDLTTSDDAQERCVNRTAEIALLRSILLGSSQNVLCCEVRHSDTGFQLTETKCSHSQAFLLSLFPIICTLCDSGTEFQYLSFQLLSMWAHKLSSCLSTLAEQEKYHSLMSKDSVIISETLRRVWLNLDSPVDGVAEFAAETLKTLLEVWHAEVKSGRSNYMHLAEELISKTVQVPWYARSRYKPLSLLVPYIDTHKLLHEKECLKQELLECMGANFLAALASDVYTAFVLAIKDKCKEEEQVQTWQRSWLPIVVSGLTSPDSLIRNKVCAYWLTSTLKALPHTGLLIQRQLEDHLQAEGDRFEHSQLLFAWVAICRHIRTFAELDLGTLHVHMMFQPELLLTEAVYSDEEDVCSEALSLLSTTQKKAEPLGEIEIRLFKAALPYCLKVDCAPFRQKLVTSLRKVFVRIRDSSSTAIKRKTGAAFVDPSLRFIDWLYGLMMSNIVPGACFQRRRTCLDIIQALLETVIFVETDGSKKGKAQGPTDVLIKYAQTKGLWDFFSTQNRTSLMHCVVDGADEIQELSVHILSKYFPWKPRTDASSTVLDSHGFAIHLLRHGLELCNSPRAYENHSGSLLIRLVYEKFAREQGQHFKLPENISQDENPVSVKETGTVFDPESEKQKACVSFFNNILLQRIESSLKASETDVLLASKSSPAHGLLQALYECLQAEQASCSVLAYEDWQNILSQTVALSTSVVMLMLQILSDGQADKCPSFAQMGSALEQLLTGDGTAEQEVTSSISPEFQLLLSWCWLNLKESCTCLGTATALTVKQTKDKNFILPRDLIEQIGDTFLKVLTHCRHRGAIEGCRNGFLQFCTSLMLCDDPILSAIPANILNRVLCNLEKDEMTSSITRRSAGLPIIVQTIIQAEKRCKMNKLLQQTVSRLYTIASQPSGTHSDQTQDQASVHALNVLKAIFSDASLSGELLSHLGKMMKLVICCFESSSWAVRNAATQLVSTLVTRMFGQRNKASLNCNMMTLQEWSAHFPELLAFVSQKLGDSLQDECDAITAVQPSLFLVLTLLASLGPAAKSDQCLELTDSLHTTVLSAVSSPVYYVRELSATALVALTPLDMTESCVRELLMRLGSGSMGCKTSNHLHGTLMCIDKLLTSRTLSQRVTEQIVQLVLDNKKLVSITEQCPVVSAKCVDVLTKAVPGLPPESLLKYRLLEMLMDILFSLPLNTLQFGRMLLIKSTTALVMNILKTPSVHTDISLPGFVTHCLQSDDVEIKSAMLECLLDHKTVLQGSDGNAFQRKLWEQLCRETDSSCIISISRLLVASYLDRQPSAGDLDIKLSPDDLHCLRSKFARLASVQTALFPVEAVILSELIVCAEETIVQERLQSSLCDWSIRLSEFSQAYQNEDFRMAAAQALALAGHSILRFCSRSPGKNLEPVVVRLVESCMTLLEETDSDIRRVVTGFVGRLQWKQKHPEISHMNTNLCSEMLLAYLCDEFGQCQALRQLLVSKLYIPGDLQTSLSKLTQPRVQHLFEHEENTFFSEKIHQQLDMYKALMKMQTGIDGTTSSLIPDFLKELRDAVPVLQDSADKKAVYNLCGDAGILASLTGLGMLLQLVTGSAKRCQDSCQQDDLNDINTEVTSELANLCQIPNLHPALSTLLRPL